MGPALQMELKGRNPVWMANEPAWAFSAGDGARLREADFHSTDKVSHWAAVNHAMGHMPQTRKNATEGANRISAKSEAARKQKTPKRINRLGASVFGGNGGIRTHARPYFSVLQRSAPYGSPRLNTLENADSGSDLGSALAPPRNANRLQAGPLLSG